jgi:fructokinase
VRDVLVVGEALVDIVTMPDGSGGEHPGGSPANVALGLARLGRSVDLLTRIGQDARGEAIRQHLEAAAVHLTPGSTTREHTSTATARVDEAGVATYDFDIDWRVDTAPDLTGYLAVHTGSIAAVLPPGAESVYELVRRAHDVLTVTYDPNARPRLMPPPAQTRPDMERYVALSDVVKVSDEDLAWLAPDADPIDVARSWLDLGPGVVVVTFGGRGAAAVFSAGHVEVAAPPITVVDTVGAGDSFMSGLVDYLAGASLLGAERRPALQAIATDHVADMLAHAVRIAGITCSRAGANPPTRGELAELVT